MRHSHNTFAVFDKPDRILRCSRLCCSAQLLWRNMDICSVWSLFVRTLHAYLCSYTLCSLQPTLYKTHDYTRHINGPDYTRLSAFCFVFSILARVVLALNCCIYGISFFSFCSASGASVVAIDNKIEQAMVSRENHTNTRQREQDAGCTRIIHCPTLHARLQLLLDQTHIICHHF